jgi:SRSO17 transposase
MRQKLQQAVVICPWKEEVLYERLTRVALRHKRRWDALVIDDTGFPKKGSHSVGVHRQYSGTLGRIENCQVAVSVHLATEKMSVCAGMRLYLPETWASDPKRRVKAQIPESVEFEEKWKIALRLLDNLPAEAHERPVLADAAYGNNSQFREALTERGLSYVMTVKGELVVWPPEATPKRRRPPKVGRPPTRFRDTKHSPVSIKELSERLKFRTVSWRSGSRGMQKSRFAAVRIRTAHRHVEGHPPGAEEWLLCEWPKNKESPTKFYLSTLAAKTSLHRLVYLAKLRWRVERDYQELKEEIGLDHYEGRTWSGFQHHTAMCVLAHAFVALRGALFSPKSSPAHVC